MPGFGGELPEPTEAHAATVAYLKSKGAKSMTPEKRAATDPFGGMMMPGGGPFGFPGGMPPEGSPYGSPKGKKPAQSKRR